MEVKPLFGRYARIHMVGIGGVGMEGLARVLRQMGCRVSGSDRMGSIGLDSLREAGFEVSVGHRSEQVTGAELVVYSAAIPPENEELVEARRRGIESVSRAELLGELTRSYRTIAVAGSHGKTTTSSMVAAILRQAGLEPSVLIGGWRDGKAQAELGKGLHFVVEADEFMRSFLRLYPTRALVTSVDAEHLDCYADLDEVEETFCQFLERIPFYGECLLAGDGQVGARILSHGSYARCTYGLGEGNDYRAERIAYTDWGSRFELVDEGGKIAEIELTVPGEHNLRNGLGAAALASRLGIDAEKIAAGLRGFRGVARRFESKGEVGGVLVIDDYAHHPTELAAALAAARARGRRLIALFQPHLYSRTRALSGEFARALCAADRVFLAAIYPSREAPIPGVDSGLIARGMEARGYTGVDFIPDRGELVERVLQSCREGDLLLSMGAGDIDQVAAQIVEGLRHRLG